MSPRGAVFVVRVESLASRLARQNTMGVSYLLGAIIARFGVIIWSMRIGKLSVGLSIMSILFLAYKRNRLDDGEVILAFLPTVETLLTITTSSKCVVSEGAASAFVRPYVVEDL